MIRQILLHVLYQAAQASFRDYVANIGDDLQQKAINKAEEGDFSLLKDLIDETEEMPFMKSPPPEMHESIEEIVTHHGFKFESH